MKSYFLKLFNYDSFANKTIIDAIDKNGRPEKAVQLMAHLLKTQQIWLTRCNGMSTLGADVWPDSPFDSFSEINTENHKAWVDYLNNLQPEEFEKLLSYQNLKGDSFRDKLSDIFTHVINHGTHHRAQIGQQLKIAGADTLPNTDYIAYVRYIASN